MEALRRAIAEYITYIETAPATPRKDGTILPLVVETLGVLKQFASYVDVLKSLPRSALVEEVCRLIHHFVNVYIPSIHNLGGVVPVLVLFFVICLYFPAYPP